MIPTTVDRVPCNTAPEVNEQIRRKTDESVAKYSGAQADQIERRLEALDREWDVERTLEANAATVALVGLGLGALVDRRFLALPAVVATFLLQHAVQGWCPPLPLFRRLGVRTQPEIEEERYALKALRGDFNGIARGDTNRHERAPGVSTVMAAVRR
ncbi:MAG: hypothetical protein MUF06_14155 [Pirellulaceae bacterium]|jgi:hypothetical protein|nr:hypothetical protein [Pirellulaceae bacterium]